MISFYKSRFARIYPLHFLTFFIALVFLQRPQLSIDYIAKMFTNITLLQSFVPSSEFYFSFNSPSWSISDEMFFYLLFPFLIYFLFKREKIFYVCFLLAVIILIIFTFKITNEKQQHFLFYINPVVRIIDFILGIILYYVSFNIKEIIFKLKIHKYNNFIEITSILIFVFFYLYSIYIPKIYRYSFWYWIPMCVVILVFYVSKNGIISKFLSRKYFVLLGEISFAFYLFHQLIGRIYEAFLNKISCSNPYFIDFLLILFITLFISSFSFKYFEMPINKKIKNIKANNNKNKKM